MIGELKLKMSNFNLSFTNNLSNSLQEQNTYSNFWDGGQDKICYSFNGNGFEECYFYEIEDHIDFDEIDENENENENEIDNEFLEEYVVYTDYSDTDSDYYEFE